jgi:leucyl aminopeptidase (aminopeptidase T)
MPDLGPAVATVIRKCLAVKANEDVLVVADPASLQIGEAFKRAATEAGADATLAVMDERATDGTEPTRPIAGAMSACDVFIAPTTRSLSHTRARQRATDGGARGATLPGVTEDMLARTMTVDFEQMAARSRAVAQLLGQAETAHVTCPLGTDLRLELTGRAGLADDGDLTAPGAFGNLPAGEGFISPRSGEGTLIGSSLASLGLTSEPAKLTVADGQLVAAADGLGPEYYRRLDAHGDLGRNLAELGVGTNEKARLTGSVLEDEKILGTVHVAFGASDGIGGMVSAPIHLDVVVLDATLHIGSTQVLDAGRYVLSG